jgi:hypothetical protein
MTKMIKGYGARRSELWALGVSGLFLVLGLLVVWLVKGIANVEPVGDAVFVSLLLMPALVYMIVSGRMKELRGPGGLGAKFIETAAQSVSETASFGTVSIEDMMVVAKGGLSLLDENRRKLENVAGRTIAMTMVLGSQRYELGAVREHIKVFAQFPNFRFVVFLDENDRVKAYMRPEAVRDLLDLKGWGDEFLEAVNEGRFQELGRYPGFIQRPISSEWTNAEALQEMMREDLDALVVVDGDGRLKGVAEREKVLGRMMLALTGQAVSGRA